MTVSQSIVRNRRSFLRIGMLATGVAVLAACGAPAANTGLTDEERATLEALGDEMAADMAADTTPKVKIKGGIRKEGTVKFYNATKGFGFIVPAESGNEDIFVHRSGILEGVTIAETDKVRFDVERGKKGLNAVNVEVYE
jgi:CspA family cold shock protein